MTWNDHDHRGEYAADGHDHYDYADRHHRHYDDESTARGLREDLSRAEEQIRELRADLHAALDRIGDLEKQTPQARQLQYEADAAAADLAGSGYRDDGYGPPVGADRHGAACQCPYCYDDPEDDEDQADEGQADEPEHGPAAMRRFMREHPLGPSDYVQQAARCAETSDGQHCGHWYDGGKCCACGLYGPDPDDEQAEEPEPEEYGPGPEVDDEGGMSEYRGWLP